MAKLLKIFVCISFLFIIHATNSFSQNFSRPDKNYVKSYFSDTKLLLNAPARWEINDWWKASIFAGSIYLLTTRDKAINDFFQKKKNTTTQNISNTIQPFGNEIVVLGIESIWFGYGVISKNEKAKQLSLLSLKITLISGAFVYAVKNLTQRTRPYQFHAPNDWNVPFSNSAYTSFFSGHALFSFGLATVISKSSKNKFVKTGSYVLASAIALSRIHDEKHWASDVFTGAVMGIVIAQCLYKNEFASVSANPQHINISFKF